jgi:hypothetical protein
MRLALLSLTLLFAQLIPLQADEIVSGNNRRSCEIWRITPENVVLIGEDSQGSVYVLKKGDTLNFELGPEREKGARLKNGPNGQVLNPGAALKPDEKPIGRIARVIDKDEKSYLVRVTQYENSVFSGTDDENKPWSLPMQDLKVLTLFPVTQQSRELKMEYSKQKPDFCGEAAIEMATNYLGYTVDQDQANKLAGLRGQRGMYGGEMVRAVAKLNLVQAPNTLSFSVRDEKLDYALDLGRLLKSLDKHRPVLLGFWADPDQKQNEAKWAFDHFVLAVGYDLKKQTVLIQDPGNRPNWNLSFEDFLKHRTNKHKILFSVEFPAVREWVIGGKKTEAEYLRREGAQVILKPTRRAEFPVNFTDLSKEDQEFVERAGS